MPEFKFVIRTEDQGTTNEDKIEQGLAACWAVIAMNIIFFRRHPDASCALAEGRVRYDSENKDDLAMVGEISTAPVLISTGVGLCIDLVAFDVASRRFHGTESWPSVFSRGGGIFHVVTHAFGPDGRVVQYDPSAELEQNGYVSSFVPRRCN